MRRRGGRYQLKDGKRVPIEKPTQGETAPNEVRAALRAAAAPPPAAPAAKPSAETAAKPRPKE